MALYSSNPLLSHNIVVGVFPCLTLHVLVGLQQYSCYSNQNFNAILTPAVQVIVIYTKTWSMSVHNNFILYIDCYVITIFTQITCVVLFRLLVKILMGCLHGCWTVKSMVYGFLFLKVLPLGPVQLLSRQLLLESLNFLKVLSWSVPSMPYQYPGSWTSQYDFRCSIV